MPTLRTAARVLLFSRRRILAAGLVLGLVLLPTPARADAGIPMLALLWPASWVLFLPVVALEAWLARRIYEYDLFKHLVSVSRAGGESEKLYYAPGGELLYRQIGSRFVFYMGEYGTITATGQAGCSGAACAPAAPALDAHVIFAGTRLASFRPSRSLYYYRSRLGSVVATTLGGASLRAGYRYSVYGETEARTDWDSNGDGQINELDDSYSELGYTNAVRLSGSLIHLKNRVYDAQARVFLQCDTVDRLRYAYVEGDPVNGADPTGLATTQTSAQSGGEKVYYVRRGDELQVVTRSANGKLSIVASLDTAHLTAENVKAFADKVALAVEKTERGAAGRWSGEGAAKFGSVTGTANGVTTSIVSLREGTNLDISIENRHGNITYRDNNPGNLRIEWRAGGPRSGGIRHLWVEPGRVRRDG
ncbi:MAG: RHS repeat-associated core domain-containing protein [Anaeromyxobacter sp.]